MSHSSSSKAYILAFTVGAAVLSAVSLAAAQEPLAAPAAPAAASPAAAPAAAPPAAAPSAWTDEPASPAPVAPNDPAAPTPVAPGAAADAPAGPGSDADAIEIGTGAPAAPSDSTYVPDAERPLTRYRQYDLGFELGMRNVVATDPSFDPYSGDDVLSSFALAATWTPLHVDVLTFGLVGEWNPGGSTGTARGDLTSLTVHRGSLGAQARLALGRRVYLSAKVAPSILAVSGNIHDPAIDRPLEADSVTWGLDATGGAAVLIARVGDPDAPAFRLWIVAEVGYAFTGAAEMSHAPEEVDDDPRLYGGVALAALDTSGVVNRFGVALTF